MECSSLLLYLENELVNTDNAEGKADTVTLIYTGVAFSEAVVKEHLPEGECGWDTGLGSGALVRNNVSIMTSP